MNDFRLFQHSKDMMSLRPRRQAVGLTAEDYEDPQICAASSKLDKLAEMRKQLADLTTMLTKMSTYRPMPPDAVSRHAELSHCKLQAGRCSCKGLLLTHLVSSYVKSYYKETIYVAPIGQDGLFVIDLIQRGGAIINFGKGIFIYDGHDITMNVGESVVLHLSLPLMKSFNKTEAAFSRAGCPS